MHDIVSYLKCHTQGHIYGGMWGVRSPISLLDFIKYSDINVKALHEYVKKMAIIKSNLLMSND